MNTKEKNHFLIFFKILLGITLPILLASQVYFTYGIEKNPMPIAIKGAIDLSMIDFYKTKDVALNGEWDFYWLELLTPTTMKDQPLKGQIHIPNKITKTTTSPPLVTPDGYATLALKIRIPDTTPLYALKFKNFASANKIWINGEEVASNGTVGTYKQAYEPQYRPQEVFFKSDQEIVEVVIQVANFHHRRMDLNTVYFGTLETITQATTNQMIKESIFTGSLLFVAIYYAILYLFQPQRKALLQLSAIALLMAIRSSVIGERILVRVLPSFSAEWIGKLGYVSALLLLPLLITYVQQLFESPKLALIISKIKYAGILILTIIVLCPLKVYAMIFEYGTLPIITMGMYLLYRVIVDGLTQKKRGSKVLISGGMIVLLAAVHDILRELSVLDTPELLSVAMTLFIIMQASFLAWSLTDAYEKEARLAKENKRMYHQIATLNQGLEEKIKQRTSELECANKELEKLSRTDALTKLMNRRYFEELLEQAWRTALEKNESLTVLMIDIDFFKGFNDTYGHVKGDECLQQVANILRHHSLEIKGDVARYGGEEFIALFPHLSLEEVYEQAKIIRRSVESLEIKHETSSVSSFVTVSIGVSRVDFAKQIQHKEALIQQADTALYKAKEEGRNRVVIL